MFRPKVNKVTKVYRKLPNVHNSQSLPNNFNVIKMKEFEMSGTLKYFGLRTSGDKVCWESQTRMKGK
jgi:hypothetical protein